MGSTNRDAFAGTRRVRGALALGAAALALAAYDTGCRRFDSALGGLGGCPFAQDALVGNIATEKVIGALKQRGAELPPLKSLDTLLKATAEIGARYTNSVIDE